MKYCSDLLFLLGQSWSCVDCGFVGLGRNASHSLNAVYNHVEKGTVVAIRVVGSILQMWVAVGDLTFVISIWRQTYFVGTDLRKYIGSGSKKKKFRSGS